MAEDPREAGTPRTTAPTRVYEREELAVVWDATRCIHVGTCFRALPEVFDPRKRPWVDINGAEAEAIAEAVRLCPTGALRIQARGSFPEEEPDRPTTIRAGRSGPLYVRGQVQLQDEDGNLLAEETRVALCRCGASANKPFCDNSHLLSPRRPRSDEES